MFLYFPQAIIILTEIDIIGDGDHLPSDIMVTQNPVFRKRTIMINICYFKHLPGQGCQIIPQRIVDGAIPILSTLVMIFQCSLHITFLVQIIQSAGIVMVP